MKILFKIFKTHLILINLSILKTIFDLVQCYLSANHFKHHQYVLRYQIALPLSNLIYFYRSRW